MLRSRPDVDGRTESYRVHRRVFFLALRTLRTRGGIIGVFPRSFPFRGAITWRDLIFFGFWDKR